MIKATFASNLYVNKRYVKNVASIVDVLVITCYVCFDEIVVFGMKWIISRARQTYRILKVRVDGKSNWTQIHKSGIALVGALLQPVSHAGAVRSAIVLAIQQADECCVYTSVKSFGTHVHPVIL